MRISFDVQVLTPDYQINELEPGVYWSEDTIFDEPGLIVVDKFGDNTFVHEDDLVGLDKCPEADGLVRGFGTVDSVTFPFFVSDAAIKNAPVDPKVSAEQGESLAAPCALLDQEFVLKLVAVIQHPELAKELTQ